MSPRRKVVWMGGAIAICGMMGQAVIRVATYARDWEAGIDEAAASLFQARRQVLAIPQISDSIARLELKIQELPAKLLAGRDEQLAGLDLVRRVTVLTADLGIVVDSVQVMSDDLIEGRLRRVGVRAFMETDAVGLGRLLGAIEADPAVSMTSLNVSAINPGEGPHQVEILDIQSDVAGWYKPEVGEANAVGAGT